MAYEQTKRIALATLSVAAGLTGDALITVAQGLLDIEDRLFCAQAKLTSERTSS